MTDPSHAARAPEIKHLRALSGGGGRGSVALVEIGGQRFVLKRSSPDRAAGERRFQQTLAAAGLASLALETHPALEPGDLLLEYVEDAPTIGGSPTLEVFGRWGAAVAGMHAIRTATFERVDSTGEVVEGSWPRFVERVIARALGAQRVWNTDLPASLLARAEAHLNGLRDFTPRRFVLTHGDLHANNALLRGRDVVLFDKASRVWTCPAAYDLALLHTEGFPGARYGVDRPEDNARMEAFFAGYGEAAPEDARWLDHFALAHSLMRYPNPFTSLLPLVIEAAVERLSA